MSLQSDSSQPGSSTKSVRYLEVTLSPQRYFFAKPKDRFCGLGEAVFAAGYSIRPVYFEVKGKEQLAIAA